MKAYRDESAGISPYPHLPERGAVNDKKPLPEPWLEEMMKRFAMSISDLSSLIENRSHTVDEYRVQSLNGETTTQITLLPDYDMFDEIIESIIVTGPTTGGIAFTLQLGKRAWNLQLPSSGILVISPVRVNLSRDANRFLTTSTAGDWSVELMGYADIRYRYK